MLSEKGSKNIERERRRGFRATFLLTFSGTPHAKHLLSRRFLDGRGPKLVSKVSDSYEAVLKKTKKRNAVAPYPAKSDDPLSKMLDLELCRGSTGIHQIQQIPRKWWQQL